ncbi:hypothetical protein [Dactylosporangium sp. CS-033363]|uniref:hypothetical protein n=1 Tax=Dactylosporangium sp. CS-033363 TaxID=3239935 RepID=UPI003D8A2552
MVVRSPSRAAPGAGGQAVDTVLDDPVICPVEPRAALAVGFTTGADFVEIVRNGPAPDAARTRRERREHAEVDRLMRQIGQICR